MAKVKSFFKKAGLWFKNHAPSKRRLIQIYSALLFNANLKGFIAGDIYQSGTKKLCTPGLNCYSCPGAVTACPLGALQDSLAHSNTTAPYYILGILGLLGLIFARTICGFFCPVGLGQELLYKIKTPKLKKSRYTRFLSYLKYVLLAVLVIAVPLLYNGVPAFCKYICPAGTFGGAGGLLVNSSNASLFDRLGYLFTWKFCLLVAFIVASVFIYRCFCRFFCPLGAIYGFFNKIALIGVKLDRQKCVDCGMCIQTCKMDIKHVGDHECINCGECIPVCPTKAISWKGSKLVLAGIDTSVTEEEKVSVKTITAEKVEQTTVSEANVAEAQLSPVETVQTAEDKAEAVKRKIKKRSFWLQFSAWALALAVLVTALVYYNFFSVAEVADKKYDVGEQFPDFTFGTVYDTAGAYNDDGEKIESIKLSDFYGTVTVINFWYTTCDPCKEELPDFREAKEHYGDDVDIIIVHINNSVNDEGVQTVIDRLGFNEWNLLFTHDTQENIFKSFDSSVTAPAAPRTLILDKDGVITFTVNGKLTYEILDTEIQAAVNK